MMLNHGFIGIGQGGSNITETFAKDFKCIVINTAETDLKELNIPDDCKIFTKVSDGGAGKNIEIGEQAIIMNRNKIKEKIEIVMRGIDYIWIVVGLGGGSGSLGSVQLIEILAEMGIKHGMICTLPMKEEGTHEKINALIALEKISLAHENSNNFRSIIVIDNEKLKEKAMELGDFSYEKFWRIANNFIYENFKTVYEFSRTSSITSFDTEDYKRVFLEKGTLLFAEDSFEFGTSNSETVLANKVVEMWHNTFFLTGDVRKATAVALILERPNDFDKDGKQINRLFTEIKLKMNSGLFCRGVYASKNNLAETLKLNRKPVRLFTLISGLPFPVEQINDLQEECMLEMKDINEKQKSNGSLSLNLDSFMGFLQQANGTPQKENLNLRVFNKTNDSDGVKSEKINTSVRTWKFDDQGTNQSK